MQSEQSDFSAELWDDFPSWVLPTRQLPVSRHGVPAADVATCDQSDVVSEDL